jgi:hypothetical protein
MRKRTGRFWVGLIIVVLLSGPLYLWLSGEVHWQSNWRTASRQVAHIAPAANDPQAVVQVYCARAYNWRGFFSQHCWLGLKPAGQKYYDIYQSTLWQRFYGKPSLTESRGSPDRYWFGHRPQVIKSLVGDPAAKLIPEIQAAIASYPYRDSYYAWPGPNSNSFIAYVGRHVPGLGLKMPSNALGSAFLGWNHFFAMTPDHRGLQFSWWGVLGVSVGLDRFELTLLGLKLGLSWRPWGIIWPAVGLLHA